MKNKNVHILITLIAFLLLASCASIIPNNTSKNRIIDNEFNLSLADSILKIGLDSEALYTLVSDIKPMSSLISLTLPIDIDSSEMIKGHVINLEKNFNYIQKIKRYTSLLKGLDLEDLDFVMVPYNIKPKSNKLFQVNVIRRSRLQQVINEHQDFFAYMGIVPETDSGIVISIIENQEQILRLRAYGYLFGYPDYAVDFFVEANDQSEKTNLLVKRDFFQIPVFKRKDGYFVYAMPKDHIPTETDSTLYNRSIKVLDKYKNMRPKYFNTDSTFQSLKLIRKFNK